MNRQSIRAFVAGAFVVLTLAFVGGCETVKGVGKDVTNVGEAGERAISK